MGVSIREFGRQVGVSHVTVQKLIKSGALPKNADGTIPLEAGLKAYRAYKNAPRDKGGRPRKGEEPKKRTPIEVVDAERSQRSEQAVNMNAAMNKAKLADTTFKAKIRELEFKFRAGELLDRSDVAAEAQWLAEQVKSKLLAIPPRISSLCEGRVAREIEEIVTDSINQALAELQKCKYIKEE